MGKDRKEYQREYQKEWQKRFREEHGINYRDALALKKAMRKITGEADAPVAQYAEAFKEMKGRE